MEEFPQSNKPDIDLFLWSKVKQGDKEAFELIFNKYYSVLCILSKRYTADLYMSREVIQNLFIYLWEHKTDLDIICCLKSYLFRATKFNSIRYMEKDRKKEIHLADIPEPEQDKTFFDHVEYAELQVRIIETIESMPDQCRKVFTMSRFEQLRYADIAERLDISVKTVESHISKALRILEENLSHY
jgi:RNA polymerase sigma-70 factor (ECF subfamily)